MSAATPRPRTADGSSHHLRCQRRRVRWSAGRWTGRWVSHTESGIATAETGCRLLPCVRYRTVGLPAPMPLCYTRRPARPDQQFPTTFPQLWKKLWKTLRFRLPVTPSTAEFRPWSCKRRQKQAEIRRFSQFRPVTSWLHPDEPSAKVAPENDYRAARARRSRQKVAVEIR